LLGWLESVHADLAAHRGVTLAEVRGHPGGCELHGRGRSPTLETVSKAAVALLRNTGGHGVRDVVPVGPRHARAGLDLDLTRPELEDLHGDLRLRLRRRRRGDTGTRENRCQKPGAAQDVSCLHRRPSFTRSTGRLGLRIGMGLLPSSGVATRWLLLAILTGSYGAGAFGMLGISPLSPNLVAGFGLPRLQGALMGPSVFFGGVLFSLSALILPRGSAGLRDRSPRLRLGGRILRHQRGAGRSPEGGSIELSSVRVDRRGAPDRARGLRALARPLGLVRRALGGLRGAGDAGHGRHAPGRTGDRSRAALGEMAAREPFGVRRQESVHLAHRVLGGAAIVRSGEVLEDRLLRLARLLLLDGLVGGVVLAAPLRPDAVVLDEGAPHGPRDLDHFFLEERRRAECRAPRPHVGQLPEEGDDRRHLRDRPDAVVRVARVAEVVADTPEQLVVIGRGAHAAIQIAEVLDQQVAGTVLAHLEVVAARVNAAEDPRKPGDQEIVLGDVGPDLLAGQGAGGEALEVLRAAKRAPRQELARQRVEPLLGRHRGRSITTEGARRLASCGAPRGHSR